MTDDRPKPHLNIGTIGSCVLCKSGLAQSLTQMVKASDSLGRKVILVTTADDVSESLMTKLQQAAEQYNATIIVSTDLDPTPNAIDLKRLQPQSMGVNDCLSGSGSSGQNGKSGARPDNWFEAPEKPWLRKGFKKR